MTEPSGSVTEQSLRSALTVQMRSSGRFW